MTERKRSWAEMAKALWQEQAKEQLAELHEEMAGQPAAHLASAIKHLEETLGKKLDRMVQDLEDADAKETTQTMAEQVAAQMAVVKRRKCHECGQPITEGLNCATCNDVYESIMAVYLKIDQKRKQRS